MNNKELHAELARRTGFSQKEAVRIVGCLTEVIKAHLADSESVQFGRLGALEVKHKEQRVMVHPKTKKRLLVPPKMVVGFRPSKSMKDRCKE